MKIGGWDPGIYTISKTHEDFDAAVYVGKSANICRCLICKESVIAADVDLFGQIITIMFRRRSENATL